MPGDKRINLERSLEIANLMLPGAISRFNDLFKKTNLARFGDYDIELGGFNVLRLTPDKPYTARTVVPVLACGDEIGDIYVIAFAPGDGTGNEFDFERDEIDIPEVYQFDRYPERVVPRSKEETIMEAFLPMVSVIEETYHDHVVSLQELTLEEVEGGKPQLVRIANLGVDQFVYNGLVRNKPSRENPYVQLTTGFLRNGDRFGDPHSIHYSTDKITRGDALQVAGFLAVHDKHSSLGRFIEEVAQTPWEISRPKNIF